MSETPSNPEPATGPVVTSTSPAATPPRQTTVVADRRGGRLTTVAAWVGIVAGVVFIVAVVFFSGFVLGKATDGGHRGGPGGHGDRDRVMIHRDGPPSWGPGGGERQGPPFGPGGPGGGERQGPPPGPGGPGAERPQPPAPPTTTP